MQVYYKFGGKNMRVNITLACTETGDRNYITTKNKRTNPERIEPYEILSTS